MNYLPVLSYGTGKRLLQRHHCCPAIDSGVACADKGNTSPLDSVVSEPKVHPGQNVQTTGSNPRPAKPPSGPRKPSTQQKKPSKPAKPVHAAEARTKAVYHAMECLLEQGAFSDADLLRAVTNLSGDEFLQVAEERALAGMCGNPRCANELQKCTPSARYKVEGRVVYNMEDELSTTCSKKCHAVTSMIAQKLGNEDAALYRFTHPAPQPPPRATPPPALSNTVIERNPSLPPSQHAAQPSKTTTQQGMQQSAPHPAAVGFSQTSSNEGMAGVHASDVPRKRSKAGVQYAAGNAKVPIMLAEIKEKDPSAAEAFAAADALRKQSMQSAAGSHTAAHAVDGFVTKPRPTNGPSSALKAQKGPGAQQTGHKEHARSRDSPTAVNTSAVGAQPHAAAVQESVCAPPEDPATRLDSECTSSTQLAFPSTEVDLSGSAEAAVTQDRGGLQTSEQPQQHRQQPPQPQQQRQQQQQHSGELSSVSSSAAPAEAPLLSFEIEDAEGPLEGASKGLAAQFGCLKVTALDGQQEGLQPPPSPSAGPHHSHLSQHYRQHPSQHHESDISSEDDLDEQGEHTDSEGTASDEEADPSTWLADPPPDFQNQPSPFGAIYLLLESWPTQSTRDYLNSETGAPRQLRQAQMLGTSQEMVKTMGRIFARVVPSVIKQLQVRVPRSSVEQHLHELLASMHFATPIPAIKDCQWQVLVMVLMKGLSLKRVFSLQDTFESRSGLTAMKTILDAQEFTEEMFDALLEVLMEG
ncbi:hypothetical protein ABBQ38_006019 [Trebouxia sp. C0009 RCD-2024]